MTPRRLRVPSSGLSAWVVAAAVSMLCGHVLLDGCTLMVGEPIEAGGVGTPCRSESDCHQSHCSQGLCVTSCSSSSQCPHGAVCWDKECHLPLYVSAFYDGLATEGEGWTWGHHQALTTVASDLGYIRLQTTQNIDATTLSVPMENAVASGARVIVATSLSLETPVQQAAKRHPDVHFVVATASMWIAGPNLTTYQGRSETAFYVAGKLATQRAISRIGLILTTPHPRVISEANAFALGAMASRPGIKIEVRWLGYWLDPNTAPTFSGPGHPLFLEELLTSRFLDSGCQVIAQLDDTSRSAKYIEAAQPAGLPPSVYSLRRNDRYGWRDPVTLEPRRTCLGSVYYDWTPQYVRVLDGIHRGTWTGRGMIDEMTDRDDTVIGVELNPALSLDDTSIRAAVSRYGGPEGLGRAFTGPYDTTGQRDADGDGQPDEKQRVAGGETVPPAELDRMCWFVKGIVEKTDPADPLSADRDARVPDGTRLPPDDFIQPPGMTLQQAFDCHSYL